LDILEATIYIWGYLMETHIRIYMYMYTYMYIYVYICI
jgi:hypothetical protein